MASSSSTARKRLTPAERQQAQASAHQWLWRRLLGPVPPSADAADATASASSGSQQQREGGSSS